MKHIEVVDISVDESVAPAMGALLVDATGRVVNAVVLAEPGALAPEPGQTLITDYPQHVGIGWRHVDAQWQPPPASEAPAPYQPDQATLWS